MNSAVLSLEAKRKCCAEMRGFVFFVFAVMLLTQTQGEDEEEEQQLGYDEQEELLECFRCDLGFWDACYTTTTNCSSGERCYTGRGKAADVLHVKTLGCAKAEECGVATSVSLYSDNTFYTVTKHCCDTPFCNAAHTPPINTCLYLTGAALSVWFLTGASTTSH